MIPVNCSICNQKAIPFDKAKVLDKYDVQYYRCTECGFIQTEDPYWLDEAYTDAINASDLGLVHRNINNARMTRSVIFLFFNQAGKFLDYAGGYGMFTRMMRDSGLDYYHHDAYCENLFAVSFDLSVIGKTEFDMLTVFEVFEHLKDPKVALEELLGYSGNILFSTDLLPSNPPKVDDWWYYGTDHGQHISIYTENSLRKLAGEFGLHFVTDRRRIHMFSRRRVSQTLFVFLVRSKLALLLGMLLKRRSLLPKDYFEMTGRRLK